MLQYSHSQAFTAAFVLSMQLYRPRRKTAHRALRWRFRLLAVFCRCCMAAHPTILYFLRHAGAYHSARTPCTGQHSRTIIIRYIRVQHIADHASPAGSAPAACGSLASATPGAPAEVSASPPVQGQPGGDLDASHARRLAVWHRVNGQGWSARPPLPGWAGGAEPLTAAAAALFGLSPDSQ